MKKDYGWLKIVNLRRRPVEKNEEVNGNRDQRILQALLPYTKSKPQSNLTSVDIKKATRKTVVAFIICPEWATNFPPYNVARLAAVSKEAGYTTYAYDLNILSYRESRKWNLGYNAWSGTRDWKWKHPYYKEELHTHLKPLIDKHINLLLDKNVDAVGFTLYYCNAEPTKYMVKELKRLKPEIKIIVGGPETQNGYWVPEPEYDYIVTGEGEQIILQVLEHIENRQELEKPLHIKQTEGERLDLDSLPRPDYSHFPPYFYDMPNGVNFELSRGCTAKCVFCSETHYWKYRGRLASRVIDEITDLYNNRGVNVYWFLDSLVNGNLKELRAFCKGIIASGMKIHWTGYARCNTKMDLEYYKDLAESGCIGLSYGIESGSDKVLHDMDKGVTVKDIEQNLIDGAIVGVDGFSTWITGFPTEEPQDFYETLTMVWRVRNSSLTAIPSGGGGFNISPETIVAQNMSRFGVAPMQYEGNWIRTDTTNSKYHRLIRVKMFSIMVDNLINNKDIKHGDRPHIGKHYKLNLIENAVNEIEYEKFNFNIINTGKSVFADSLMNEIWPLLRIIYRTRGAYHIHIDFNPDLDTGEFGDTLTGNFYAAVDFTIDSKGNYTGKFSYNYKQKENAWNFFDMSGAKSLGADRARQLSGADTNIDFHTHYKNAIDTYQYLNLSFEYNFELKGNW